MKTFSVGTWDVNVSEGIEIFPREALTSAQTMIQKWVEVFPKEETWVMKNHGVPSLFIRIDCFLGSNELHIVEIEERPAGIGVSKTINKQFAAKLKDFLNLFPPIAWVSSSRREAGDDHLWTSLPQDEDLLIVRCDPDEEEFHRLKNRSISSISYKGDKSYGISMGLWKKISWGEEIPWEEAFVLKPTQGSKCKDVTIWIPKDWVIHELSVKRKELRGCSTKSKVEKVLSFHGTMFLQPFTPPMVCPHLQLESGPYFMLYRIFFFFDPVKQEYVPAGGVWTARLCQLLLHGASDAISGPLMIED